MKKFSLFIVFILLSGITFSQTIEKGNLVAFYVLDLNLDPDVTYNQWKDINMNKYIPALNKAYKGDATVYLLEGIRGEEKNEIAWVFIFQSEEIRNKYFDQDGNGTGLYSQVMREATQEVSDELPILQKTITRKYYDWIVQ